MSTYEDQLLGNNGKPGAIERGALTDKDIYFIQNSGDRRLKNALEQKYNREKSNSEHVQRMYGSAFTNKDNDGNLYKDTDVSSPLTKPTVNQKNVQKMQQILKENL